VAVAGALALMLTAGGCAQKNDADLRRRGDHYLQAGQYGQAAEEYAAYLQLKPGEDDVRGNYGRALLKTGRAAEAAEQLQIAYTQNPEDDQVLDALTEALLASNQPDALFRLLKSNASDRGRVADFLRLGRASLKVGDTDTAYVAFTQAAKVDKGQTVEAQLGMVDYYLSVRDPANATRRLRMAYFISQHDPEVQARIRLLKPVIGPTFAAVPEERGQ
jgi:Tfp pilus assembly protein PilF